MKDIDPIEPLLTAKDVAKIFKCSLPLVYRMAERNQIRCVRWECEGNGKKKPRMTVRFEKNDVLEFIERSRER